MLTPFKLLLIGTSISVVALILYISIYASLDKNHPFDLDSGKRNMCLLFPSEAGGNFCSKFFNK